MDKKICGKCGTEKSFNDFNKKGKGLQPWCRECNRLRSKAYYNANREHHKTVTIERKNKVIAENHAKFQAIKAKCKCPNCGESEPICLDFHHTGNKEKMISRAIHSGWRWERIVREMKKCIVLCSNCHRKLHIGKLNEKNFSLWNEQ